MDRVVINPKILRIVPLKAATAAIMDKIVFSDSMMNSAAARKCAIFIIKAHAVSKCIHSINFKPVTTL